MEISSGLFAHGVWQRGADNRSAAVIAGTCSAAGAVTARVTRNGKPVRGYAGKAIGEAAGGSFTATLSGLAVGGPYEVTLSVGTETVTVGDVLVGDVWLLGGQSNMQGVGILAEGTAPHPLVRNWYMDDRWDVAKEHLHNMYVAVDRIHADLSGGALPAPMLTRGVCPGIPFGKEMLRLTKVPQGLIACGHGGTSMAQWDPGRRDEGGKSLYGALVRRLRKIGGKVAGLLWYQGESDAGEPAVRVYMQKMIELLAAVRRDTGDPQLPVAIVQISRVVGWGTDAVPCWNSIQDQERLLQVKDSRVANVPAIDLSLDDCIHISARGHERLGKRLAQAMNHLRGGPQAGPAPIALGKIELDTVPDNATGLIKVTFDNVVGELRAGSRPWGFTTGERAGEDRILDVRLQGNQALLYTTMPALSMASWVLSYGYGANPYCNITDAADRSLPVFGPVPLGKPAALTGFVRQWRVSGQLPSAGKLEGLSYPGRAEALGLTARTFPADFADRHLEWKPGDPDALLYYACAFTCQEAMELTGRLGYDGPVKVWVDGRELYHDPNGTNPAIPDHRRFEFAGAPGRHEVLIAFATNNGRAWGVFFRLERRDVAPEKIQEGPWAYQVPTLEA